jgi:hypothetical protein
MTLRAARRTVSAILIAAGMTAALGSTPASAHVISCSGTPNTPVKDGTGVYAIATASCTDFPDTYEAQFTMWAWTGSKYIGQGQKTYTAAPVPNQVYGIGTICRRGYIYHSELEIWAHHGNSIHEIYNSATTGVLC